MTTTSELSMAPMVTLALRGLEPLYDPRRKLFAYKIDRGRLAPMPMVETINYTATCVLGLIKARDNGWPETSVDAAETVRSLVGLLDHVALGGELGLVLWADARCEGDHRETLLKAIARQVQARKLAAVPTIELAWLLTGLCYSHRCSDPGGLAETLAMKLFAALSANFVPNTGLYRHTGAGNEPSRLRSPIGNFADQIYSVYALASFYEEFGRDEALRQALQCAWTLCALQGSRGQWWWHYHAPRGVVASRYPVFAVHQHGMAPMALNKLSATSGGDFTPAVTRGLNWLLGNNELGLNMVDCSRRVVWRGIQKAPMVVHLRYASMFLADRGLPEAAGFVDSVPQYRLIGEMRPYELGWLICAFADRWRESPSP